MKKKVSIVLNNKKLFDFECDWLSLSSSGDVSTKNFGDVDLGFNRLGKCFVSLSYDDENPTIHLALDKESAEKLAKRFESASNEKNTQFELPTEIIDSYKKFKESWDKYMHENMYFPRNIMKDYAKFSKGLSDNLEEFDIVEFPTILFGSPAIIKLWKTYTKDKTKADSIHGVIDFAFIHSVGIYGAIKEIDDLNKFIPLDSYVCCEDSDIMDDSECMRIYNHNDGTYSILYESTEDLLDYIRSFCASDTIYSTLTEFSVPILNCSIEDTVILIARAINNWCRDICYMINKILCRFEKDCIIEKKPKSVGMITISHVEEPFFKLLDDEYDVIKPYGDLCSELTREFECTFTQLYDGSTMLFKMSSEDGEDFPMDIISVFSYSTIIRILINLIEYTENITADDFTR